MPLTSSQRAALIAVTATNFFAPFMFSAVGVALPAIQHDLNATAVQLGLVETAYILALTVGLLPAGRLGDILGRKKVFAAGVAVFTVAGALLAAAWSIESFIAIRALQGLGGSTIATAGIAILSSVFPPDRRGYAMGWAVGAVYAGLSAGPFMGGLITTHLGWRWIFAMTAPLGAATVVLILSRLKEEFVEAHGEPFDVRGTLVYAAAVVLVIVGALMIEESSLGWGVLASGLIAFFLFDRLQARTRHPILDVSLFRTNRVFALTTAATMIHYAATFGLTFFMSLYLQFVRGFTPQGAGTMLMIQPALMAALSPLAGKLSDIFPAARVSTVGMAVTAVGLAMAASLGPETDLTMVVAMLLVMGVGFALFSSPNMTAVLGCVERKHYGTASGVVAAARTMGMMASMCLVTVVFSIYLGGSSINAQTLTEYLKAMDLGLAIFVGLCLVGIWFSFGRITRTSTLPKD